MDEHIDTHTTFLDRLQAAWHVLRGHGVVFNMTMLARRMPNGKAAFLFKPYWDGCKERPAFIGKIVLDTNPSGAFRYVAEADRVLFEEI